MRLTKDKGSWAESRARGGKKGNATNCAKAEHPDDVPDPAMTDRCYEEDEEEFLRAMAAYQARTGRRFPTWTEALSVLKGLGYARPAPPDLAAFLRSFYGVADDGR